jgi:hypothetical protein
MRREHEFLIKEIASLEAKVAELPKVAAQLKVQAKEVGGVDL